VGDKYDRKERINTKAGYKHVKTIHVHVGGCKITIIIIIIKLMILYYKIQS
jgi:hypothetical protein